MMRFMVDDDITWQEIIEIEPRIKELYEIAKNENRPDLPDDYCANAIFYRQLKPEIVELVGWGARKEELRTSRAYDEAYEKILDALPACQHERLLC